MFDKPPLTEIGVSALATAAIAALALLDRRHERDLLLLWVGATSLILVVLGHAPSGLIVGVAITMAAPLAVDQPVRRGLLILGAVTAALSLTHELDAWLRLVSLLIVAGTGPLLWYSFRECGQLVTIVLVAGTACGIYVNVPDTEQISVIASGLVVLAAAMILLTPLRTTTSRFETLLLIAALVIGSGAVGARGRPGAFIGVVGALGVFFAEPVAALVRRGTRAHPVVLVCVHAGAVLITSRIAGVRGPGSAIPIVTGVLAGTLVVLMLVPRRRSPVQAETSLS